MEFDSDSHYQKEKEKHTHTHTDRGDREVALKSRPPDLLLLALQAGGQKKKPPDDVFKLLEAKLLTELSMMSDSQSVAFFLQACFLCFFSFLRLTLAAGVCPSTRHISSLFVLQSQSIDSHSYRTSSLSLSLSLPPSPPLAFGRLSGRSMWLPSPHGCQARTDRFT